MQWLFFRFTFRFLLVVWLLDQAKLYNSALYNCQSALWLWFPMSVSAQSIYGSAQAYITFMKTDDTIESFGIYTKKKKKEDRHNAAQLLPMNGFELFTMRRKKKFAVVKYQLIRRKFHVKPNFSISAIFYLLSLFFLPTQMPFFFISIGNRLKE